MCIFVIYMERSASDIRFLDQVIELMRKYKMYIVRERITMTDDDLEMFQRLVIKLIDAIRWADRIEYQTFEPVSPEYD